MERERVRAILAEAGIEPERLRSHDALAGGTFNSVHRVRLDGDEDLVLKVAPAPGTPLMTYESGLTRAEELFYRRAHGLVPVPEVVHADHREAGGSVLMTLCPGRTWYEVGERISPGGRSRLRSDHRTRGR